LPAGQAAPAVVVGTMFSPSLVVGRSRTKV
jgi:hypothetical protein